MSGRAIIPFHAAHQGADRQKSPPRELPSPPVRLKTLRNLKKIIARSKNTVPTISEVIPHPLLLLPDH